MVKYITTVIKGNIRKNKGVYIGIFLLMMLVSITFYSIITFYINSNKRVEEGMEANGFGDMLAALRPDMELKKLQIEPETIANNIRSCEDVSEVKLSDVIYTMVNDCNGHSSKNNVFILSQDDKSIHYTQYDEKGKVINKKLEQGELSVPTSYIEMYNCKIGDTIVLGNDNNSRSYKVASYFEDPYMGASLMGVKTILTSEESFKEMLDIAKGYKIEDKDIIFESSKLLNIKKKENSTLNYIEFEKELNSKSDFAAYCSISISKEQAHEYMMMLSNIFSAILILFVIIFLVATFIVLGHNIKSGIELDYTNIGILKAVGMTNGNLRTTIIIGYLSAAFAGILVGIPISIPVVKFLSQVTMPSSGLFVSSKMNPLLIIVSTVVMLLMIVGFILIKTVKLKRVTPLKAIQGGLNNVHFSSRLKLPVSKKLLNTSLAYRQFVSEKKQYIAVIIITALLTACIIMMNDACRWVNNDDTMTNMFSVAKSDINAKYISPEVEARADEIIGSYTNYEKYKSTSQYMLFDDLLMYCNIIDRPEFLSTIMEGRTCLYDNEILITPLMADGFNLKIGDEVNINKDGREETFLVSGIYNSASDVGKNFTMSYEGYKKFIDEDDARNKLANVSYLVNDRTVVAKIIGEMSKEYEKGVDFAMVDAHSAEAGVLDQLAVIQLATNGITVLIYVLGAIFVIITVSIVCGKIVSKEKRDYGIYKSLGLTSKNIRIQLAIRFVVSAVIGSIIGIVLDLMLSGYLFSLVFESFGIYNYENEFSSLSAIIPIVFMAVIFALAAYVKSARVKTVDARVLIVE
ncbi:MAG TPA: ABC transporter permease [Clostridium sp.]|jgi:putative ABC transport system permease protein|nr:ABC transporter permease [Clostridium sp.]